MSKTLFFMLSGLFVILLINQPSARLRTVQATTGDTTTITLWVYFVDKPENGDTGVVTLRARNRRKKAGYKRAFTKADVPVYERYISGVLSRGARLRHPFKWDNCASFTIPARAVAAVVALPYVTRVTPVRSVVVPVEPQHGLRLLHKIRLDGRDTLYGASRSQLDVLNIPAAHEYLQIRNPVGQAGNGVLIAFFDSGFRTDLRSLNHLNQQGSLKAIYDFVDKDTTVYDPDSVVNDMLHPYFRNDEHGTEVLGVAVGYDPPYYVGGAYGADVVLARTEDTYFDREYHREEDNWAAAVVWAESLGVDIISSSLGYREDFKDTIVIERLDGTLDTIRDYRYADMDGNSSIVSRAARYAVERGITVVNAIGNEGSIWGDGSLSAPADVDGVVAVGAVDFDRKVVGFSSTGPTSDGRLKPEVVAPGYGVAVPLAYYPDATTFLQLNGTSFATPLIAAVFALVKQAYPEITSSKLRERVYRFCSLPAGESVVNNRCGYGIPDALKSCMGDEQLYLTVSDTGNLPASSAIIRTGAGDSVGITDKTGHALFSLEPATVPQVLSITTHGQESRFFTVDSLPFWLVVQPCSLSVIVTDEKQLPVPFPSLYWYRGEEGVKTVGDSSGVVVLSDFLPAPVRFRVQATGFLPSDTIGALLCEHRCSFTVVLMVNKKTELVIFPTLIRRSRGDQLHASFTAPIKITAANDFVRCAVRTVNGSLVYQNRFQTLADLPARVVWNCKAEGGREVAPGVYFFTLEYQRKLYRKKFIIVE